MDNKSGKGVAELWQAIDREVVKLEEFGAERPKSWIDARDAILTQREGAPAYQMPFADFRKLATDKGVAADAVETFAAMLTSQGRIVYHGDDRHLAGTVVLDPEWLMKAIAYVLTDKETKDANGILPETSLARIWLNHARAQGREPDPLREGALEPSPADDGPPRHRLPAARARLAGRPAGVADEAGRPAVGWAQPARQRRAAS